MESATTTGASKIEFVILVEPRDGVGSRRARHTRRDGKIPSVVYARGEAAINVAIAEKEFLKAASAARTSQVFQLKSSDKNLDGRSALVKEIQKDYVANRVLHVDIQTVRDDEEIAVRVPTRVVGEAPGVKLDGGVLTVVSHEITVRCLPKKIPSEVLVDVSELRLGDSIHAKALKLPEGVKLAGNPGETLVSVVAVRNIIEEEEAAAAAAAAATPEGAAAAAPGAAPAAGAPAAAAAAPAADKKAEGKK